MSSRATRIDGRWSVFRERYGVCAAVCGPAGRRFGLEFCKTSSFSAGGQGSGGRIATMIEIEIPEDDLSGVDAKQRTTSPMADDLAFPCDFNVDSV